MSGSYYKPPALLEVLDSSRYVSENDKTYTTQTAYDPADRVTQITYPDTKAVIAYSYDEVSHLVEVESLWGTGADVVFYQAGGFNEMHQETTISYGNGRTTQYEYYDQTRRLKRMLTSGGSTIQDIRYTYDMASNILSVTDAAHTGVQSCGLSNIQYDDLYRLVSLYSTAEGRTITYEYTALGNTNKNGEMGTNAYAYAYAGSGHSHTQPHAVTSANGNTYSYDACGNMITRNRSGQTNQTLTYDEQNRLVQVSDGNNVTFGYSAGGSRLWKKVNGQITGLWIGSLYEEKSGRTLCHVHAGGRWVATFEPWTDAPIGDSVFYYYHPDHLGSSQLMTDPNGEVVQQYGYSPFGRDDGPAPTDAFQVSNRYTRQILDEDIGLYYYGARYYDPELARFIQADSVVPDLDSSQALNRYTYVYNNPLKLTDPTGNYPSMGGMFEGAYMGAVTAGFAGGDMFMGAFVGAINGAAGCSLIQTTSSSSTALTSLLTGNTTPSYFNFTADWSPSFSSTSRSYYEPVPVPDYSEYWAKPLKYDYTSGPDTLTILTTPVGSPGLGERLIPVWGSSRSAINDFQTGHDILGTGNVALAMSDVFLVKAIVTGVAKTVGKGATKGVAFLFARETATGYADDI